MKVPDQWECLTDTLPTTGKQDCDYTKADVIDMLRYIGAPRGLKGLISVARSLQEVLSALDRLLEERSKFYSELWRHICHDILKLQKIVEKRIPSVHVAGDKRKIRGPHMQHPLYGLLWHRARLGQYQRQFSVLQAIAVYWFVKIARNHQGHGLVYNWLRYVRALSEESPLTKAILPLLPTEPASLQGYYRSLVKIIDKTDLDAEAVKHIQVLCRLVKSALNERVPPPRQAEGGVRPGAGGGPIKGDMPGGWHEKLAEYAVDIDEEEMFVTHFLENPEDFVATGAEPGLAPGEITPGRESLLLATRHGDSGCYTLAEYAHKYRYARAAISLENQQLVTRQSVMRDHEQHALFKSLAAGEEARAWLRPDTRLLLDLTLAIGRKCSEIVSKNPQKNADRKDDDAITYIRSNRMLCLPTLQNLPRPRLREDRKGAVRVSSTILHLPAPVRLALLIESRYPRRRTRSWIRIGDLLGRELEEYEGEISQFLAKINKCYQTRLTRARIECWLFERIARLPGAGRCEAAAITGRVPPFLDNALHYVWTRESRLQEIYRQAVQPLACGGY